MGVFTHLFARVSPLRAHAGLNKNALRCPVCATRAAFHGEDHNVRDIRFMPTCGRPIDARARQAAREQGFTLLELLVVMVIIGLLAGLVAPRYFEQIGKSNTKIARAQIESLGKALDQYRLDVGAYPTTEEGL